MSNYPKRFEILKNNGKTLEFRVDQLAKDIDKCFVKHFINDDWGSTMKITIPGTLEYAVSQSGRHIFSFFEQDLDVVLDALSDGIDLKEDNDPI